MNTCSKTKSETFLPSDALNQNVKVMARVSDLISLNCRFKAMLQPEKSHTICTTLLNPFCQTKKYCTNRKKIISILHFVIEKNKTKAYHLTFTTLWANLAHDKLLIYFLFFQKKKTGCNISCKLSPMETICMNSHILFYGKNKKNTSKILWRQFAWTVASCFMGKIRKILQNVCWNF